jgi:predicted enzyme related to lactoylglutathione lyase
VMGAGTISEMKNLECITLFVEDLAASKKFYLEIFDLKIVYEDRSRRSSSLRT